MLPPGVPSLFGPHVYEKEHKMFKRVMTSALLFGMLGLAPPALAMGHRSDRDTLIERLQSMYSERLTAGGLQKGRSAQQVMEIWASDKTGSFTVLVTSPQGISCVVATGTDYFAAKPANDEVLGKAS